MMPPRSVYLNCNRSFHTLWARCFEGGGNVRSVQLYVCVCGADGQCVWCCMGWCCKVCLGCECGGCMLLIGHACIADEGCVVPVQLGCV